MIFIYLKEIIWILYYFLFSIFLCSLIFLSKYHSIILYSSFALLKLIKQKLFIFGVFDILNIMNLLLFFYMVFFIWFLFTIFIYFFVSSSLYKNQLILLINFFYYLIFFRVLSFIFINIFLIYFFVYLLINWEFTTILHSFTLFNIQVKTYDFILTWIQVNCNFYLLIDIFLLVNYITCIYLNCFKFWKNFKNFKNIFLFIFVSVMFILITDFYYIFFPFFFIFEFYYFFLCYKTFSIIKKFL